MGMFALCHNLVYACPADIPFVQDPAVCDYKEYVQNYGCADTNWATETFQQVSATSCQNDQGRSPRYDHCGLYIMENSRDLKLHRIYKAMAGSLIQHCSGLVHLQL